MVVEAQSPVVHRIQNTQIDEVLYADDTVCISNSARNINYRRSKIGTHGEGYCVKYSTNPRNQQIAKHIFKFLKAQEFTKR